jgi:hypothetical protein
VSEDTRTIHQRLNDVENEVRAVGKGDRNDFHKFMFRGVDRVTNAVAQAFRRHGVLGPFPRLIKLESRDTPTEKGKTAREVTVTVEYRYVGLMGDEVKGVVPGEAADTGDKAVSKAMSVAYRTWLIQSLNLPTEQIDPDSQTYTRADRELTGWKQRIKQAADERGWSVEELALNFEEWSAGEDIRSADVDVLKEYHAHLVPPKTMQRAQ